jgi:hypothetical protein
MIERILIIVINNPIKHVHFRVRPVYMEEQ